MTKRNTVIERNEMTRVQVRYKCDGKFKNLKGAVHSVGSDRVTLILDVPDRDKNGDAKPAYRTLLFKRCLSVKAQ